MPDLNWSTTKVCESITLNVVISTDVVRGLFMYPGFLAPVIEIVRDCWAAQPLIFEQSKLAFIDKVVIG